MRRAGLILLFLAACRPELRPSPPALGPASLSDILWINRFAVDLRSGTVVWKVPFEREVQSDHGISAGERVFLQHGDGAIEARGLLDGRRLWSTAAVPEIERKDRQGYPVVPTLVIGDSTLLQVTVTRARAFDLRDGREAWSVPMEISAWSVAEGYVLTGPSGTRFIDERRGVERWAAPDLWIHGLVAVDGDVIIASETGVRRLRGSDGTPIWNYAPPLRMRPGRLLRAGSFIVVGPGDEQLWTLVLDSRTGGVTWSHLGHAPEEAALSFDGSRLFVALVQQEYFGPGEIWSVSTESWTREWTASEAWKGSVKFLVSQGRLFAAPFQPLSFDVDLASYEDSAGELLWKGVVEGFQVPHSIYGNLTTLERRGDTVVVVSRQTGGDLMEVFDLHRGTAISRWSWILGDQQD